MKLQWNGDVGFSKTECALVGYASMFMLVDESTELVSKSLFRIKYTLNLICFGQTHEIIVYQQEIVLDSDLKDARDKGLTNIKKFAELYAESFRMPENTVFRGRV